MDRNEVRIAFEILLEEIEAVANGVNDAGARAFQKGDYEEARKAIELGTRLAEFRAKVKALLGEWANLSVAPVTRTAPKKRKRTLQKLQRGVRTPEDAFRRPILEALAELGGKGTVDEVLRLVEEKMKDVLNPYDWKPLPSDPKMIRWRNTAQWCRNAMAREGFLKPDSPRGIWEISERGREVLRKGEV